jgi:hypothetical protein
VLFFAVGCTALVYANAIWRQVVFTLVIGVLSMATVMAFVPREQPRAFVIGFVVSGWLYLLFVFTPIIQVKDHLLTTQALVQLGKAMQGWPTTFTVMSDNPGKWDETFLYSGGRKTSALQTRLRLIGPSLSSTPADFFVIGHSLWTLSLACVGGLWAKWLSSKRAGAQV